MSETGSNTFSAGRKKMRRRITRDNKIQVHIKCANCASKALLAIPVRMLFAYPPGDARRESGYDREVMIENWCLDCVRSSFIEDDKNRTNVSVSMQ